MKVLCKETCIASDMGLGYCFEGKIYEVGSRVAINPHFKKLKSPKAEMADLKKEEPQKESPVEEVIKEPTEDKE